MDITLKNFEIIGAVKSLSEILQLDILTTKVNWNMSKNLRKLQSSCDTYAKCELELLNKYVLRDENKHIKQDESGNPMFDPKMKDEYMLKLNELLGCEDTVDILQIKLNDLPDKMGKGINLNNIMFMIDDTE